MGSCLGLARYSRRISSWAGWVGDYQGVELPMWGLGGSGLLVSVIYISTHLTHYLGARPRPSCLLTITNRVFQILSHYFFYCTSTVATIIWSFTMHEG